MDQKIRALKGEPKWGPVAIAGHERSRTEMVALTTRASAIQRETADLASELLSFMSTVSRANGAEVRDGKVVFREKSDLEKYNALIGAIAKKAKEENAASEAITMRQQDGVKKMQEALRKRCGLLGLNIMSAFTVSATVALFTVSLASSAESVYGFDFPKELGGFKLEAVIDNEKDNPGLGQTLFYNAPGVKVSVYVYGQKPGGLPTGIDASVTQRQFDEARTNIEQLHPDAQSLVRQERLSVASVPFLHAAFQYVETQAGKRDTVFSHLYLTSQKGSFVKIRATYSAIDQPRRGHDVQVQFVEALGRVIGQ